LLVGGAATVAARQAPDIQAVTEVASALALKIGGLRGAKMLWSCEPC
jgi:hypothetical protein